MLDTVLYLVTGSSILGPDMALNIDCLLEKIPERKRHVERKQVSFIYDVLFSPLFLP